MSEKSSSQSVKATQDAPESKRLRRKPGRPIVARLKAERVQGTLQAEEVQQRVGVFLSKLAACEDQRVRVDIQGSRVALTVQGNVHKKDAGALAQAALDLGDVA